MARYEPRGDRSKRIRILIVVAVLLLLLGYFGYKQIKPSKTTSQGIRIGNLSQDNTIKALNKSYDTTYSISDHLFYGESLAMLKNTYDPTVNDDMFGKTVVLKDLLSDKKYTFVTGSGFDRQILLNRLTKGFYEVYVQENLVDTRMAAATAFKDSIWINSNNGGDYNVQIIADKNMLKDYGKTMKDNYVFISVNGYNGQKVQKKSDIYDIALDPAGNTYDFTNSLDKGAEGNGLVESEESYNACVMMKKKLEEAGYKVIILRNKNQELNSYGTKGRLAKAYKAHAKYYFHIGFSESDSSSYSGALITYSGHATQVLSSQIIYDLGKSTSLKGSTVYTDDEDEAGLIQCSLLEGDDGRAVYDSDLWIRESGGRATQAGMYSSNAQKGTGSFAKDNNYGMYGLSISLGYLSNSDDANAWKTSSEVICNSVAQSIAEYING